ncbi:amino acid ABC transporter substrate-binding protein, PAAT family [Arsukibacterium tuosuense]|uniref:Amino acid ABC transporter substrate-binding protein, PAAT family n=1 Tax=Arsukibacterium tuosuense TaxID=1323745 RepID=A0A285JA46_9GAMM|nr:transporter substrate-binding domain-containing protein [Arsukibacterium tuosuense]SNY57118.1 amino acid ABC transporter substrate-binding protein, PAAT family [Arsukibacterium tuosuense]
MMFRLFNLLLLMLLSSAAVKAEVIRLASSNYYPHYGEQLAQQGATIEIIRQAFALQGVQLEIEFLPFARALYESQQGHYSGLVAAWYSDQRAEHFYFSQPLYANQIVLFKRKTDIISFQNFQDLARQHKRLGAVQGYMQPIGLVESGIETIQVATDEQALAMLARQRVDLVPADLLNGLYLLENLLPQHQQQLDWLTPVLEQRPMYLVLSKKDPANQKRMERFNLGLQQLKASGQYQQIIETLLPQY